MECLTLPTTSEQTLETSVTWKPRATTPLGRSTASAIQVTMATESTVCPRNIKWLRLYLEVSEREDEGNGKWLPDKYEKVVSKDRTYARIIFFLSDLEPGVASNVVNFMGLVP